VHEDNVGIERVEFEPDVVARRVEDEVVLVHLGRNEIFALNATGARLWELLAEGCSVSEANGQLSREYDVGVEQVRAETDALLKRLSDEGLVRVT
jgi:hypothetical protein